MARKLARWMLAVTRAPGALVAAVTPKSSVRLNVESAHVAQLFQFANSFLGAPLAPKIERPVERRLCAGRTVVCKETCELLVYRQRWHSRRARRSAVAEVGARRRAASRHGQRGRAEAPALTFGQS